MSDEGWRDGDEYPDDDLCGKTIEAMSAGGVIRGTLWIDDWENEDTVPIFILELRDGTTVRWSHDRWRVVGSNG